MYFLQQGYTLADEALQGALLDNRAMREFVGIDLGCENVPDAKTLFRRPLEQHDLTAAIPVASQDRACSLLLGQARRGDDGSVHGVRWRISRPRSLRCGADVSGAPGPQRSCRACCLAIPSKEAMGGTAASWPSG